MTQLDLLQTPFLQQDLVTRSGFISYCKENGVNTDSDELEFFDRERLLVPAVRVILGTVEYRKILSEFDGKVEWRYVFSGDVDKFNVKELDPTKYYDRGSLRYGNSDWMDWYTERGMIKYPSKEGFIKWANFTVRNINGQMFGNDIAMYENASELMYAKHQIYPLKTIQNRRTLRIKNMALFKTPEEWSKSGAIVSKMFSEGDTNEQIQETVGKWNRFFRLLMDVRRLLIEKNETITDVYKRAIAENGGNSKEATADARSSAELFDNKSKKRAKDIVNANKYIVADIEDWRFTLLGYGSFGIGSRSQKFRVYINRLDNELLDKTEDVYRIVNQLSWFIQLLGGKGLSAKQLILRSMNETCIFCGRYFVSTRNTQKTCGAQTCKRKLQNQHKKEMRRLGKY